MIKFDGVRKNGDHGVEDAVEYTRIEYAYSLMAKDSGIVMNDCRLWEENGRYHFMTKRFDRIGNKKIHMQTLAALAHVDYNIPGLSSYEEAAGIAMTLTGKKSDTEELFRRMVFNTIMVNQDDHVKNIAFLMDKHGIWSLAPAYDLTFAYNLDNRWLRAHQMRINGKTSGINNEDLISAGLNMGLSRPKCNHIIEQIMGVSDNFSLYMHRSGVSSNTIDVMSSVRNSIIAN